ncbi:putative F-box protein At4g21240 isoform X1 [Helianthus annuus]|uniref:putative F-box protein At4g21240 isoform X1 n=1 Tax=Helianthus annuus TaxID=4232 RepID=UPI000B8F6512|nr:putative F-box protein At4g21240 isoform X1 [Helianthus annuus]
MKTLEDEQSTITDDRSKMSFPKEIIEDILSRLPVKSILRFKSVSKPWLSLISAPSFHNLHSAVGSRTTALFFSAFDSSTGTRYFFSGANDGGSVANLMKLDNIVSNFAHKFAEHLNGCSLLRSLDRGRKKQNGHLDVARLSESSLGQRNHLVSFEVLDQLYGR